ncbi:unnamed protein product [Rotaria sp. Silwood1]|nr:unnamed protein product [Rotaria sp. Silwood1]
MLTDAFMKSNIFQWSDWSTSEPVVSQKQQQTFDKPSKSNIRSRKMSPNEGNLNNSKSTKKEKNKHIEQLRLHYQKSSAFVGGNVTLRWNTTGITVAGIMNQRGTASNLLDWPMGLAIDSSNTLYVAEYSNNRVQKFLSGMSNGTTVAEQANGVQNRTSTTLNFPVGVTVDSSGNIYVADSGNSRVQLWASGASSGSTVAGNGREQANIVKDIE